MSTITKTIKIDGTLTDPTSVKLSSSDEVYGVKRNDTQAVVVADDTAMSKVSTGVYTYSFTDPADDLTYTYSLEVVRSGETYWITDTFTGPVSTTEPITLAEAKAYARVDTGDDDDLIQSLITAAREYIETFCNRTLITTARTEYLEAFPGGDGVIRLPYPPLRSVTSIGYVDTAGDDQTVDSGNYDVDTDAEPGRVKPAYGETWPGTRAQMNAVTISYSAGYGDASVVPHPMKALLKILANHWYEHREPILVGSTVKEVPLAARTLLWQFRTW